MDQSRLQVATLLASTNRAIWWLNQAPSKPESLQINSLIAITFRGVKVRIQSQIGLQVRLPRDHLRLAVPCTQTTQIKIKMDPKLESNMQRMVRRGWAEAKLWGFRLHKFAAASTNLCEAFRLQNLDGNWVEVPQPQQTALQTRKLTQAAAPTMEPPLDIVAHRGQIQMCTRGRLSTPRLMQGEYDPPPFLG